MHHSEPAAADAVTVRPGPSPAAGTVPSRNDASVATWRSAGRRLRVRLSTAALRIRRRWRSAAFRAARLTGAAVAAYLVAEALGLVNPPPLVAALAALLVVQATATSTLSSGVERVLAVLAGVAIATGFAFVVGLTWWSLGILVAAAIVVGQLLRLGRQPHRGADQRDAGARRRVRRRCGTAALSRLVETLIGAAVGVLVTWRSRPPCRSRYAGQAVQRLAEEIAALLEEAAQGMGTPTPACPRPARSPTRATCSPPAPAGSGSPRSTAPRATSGSLRTPPRRWLDDARRLNRHVPRVNRGLTHAEESRRLNVRALGSRGECAEPARWARGARDVLRGSAHAVPGDRRLGPRRDGGARRRVRRAGPGGLDGAAQ